MFIHHILLFDDLKLKIKLEDQCLTLERPGGSNAPPHRFFCT